MLGNGTNEINSLSCLHAVNISHQKEFVKMQNITSKLEMVNSVVLILNTTHMHAMLLLLCVYECVCGGVTWFKIMPQ